MNVHPCNNPDCPRCRQIAAQLKRAELNRRQKAIRRFQLRSQSGQLTNRNTQQIRKFIRESKAGH